MKIQDTIIQTLLKNPTISNQDCLKIVQNTHKNCKTSVYCISWYRSKLKTKDPRYLKYIPHRTEEEEKMIENEYSSNVNYIEKMFELRKK
jgi:hypothetical protein